MRPVANVLFALVIAIISTSTGAADYSLRLIGQIALPTGTMFKSVEFGGISGIDRDANGTYWVISDDRGGERGMPRFYNLSLNYDTSGFKGVTINSQRNMQRPDGSALSRTEPTVDPESIRVAPNGNLYWSSEGNWSTNAATRYQPFVQEMRTDGTFVREFNTPAMYNYVDNTTSGGRNNKLFEALTVSPNGTVWTANEDALIQDGPASTLNAGSVIRVTRLDPASGNAIAQYAYQLPSIPIDAAPGTRFGPDNGLSELLALSDTHFIAVERAFAPGVGNTIRLVLSDIVGATNVLNDSSLVSASYTSMSRELLLEMAITYQGIILDNIEGISWGETFANGNRTLILVADNNFSRNQTTQFIALELVAEMAYKRVTSPSQPL